jgi:large subunit ribosomal protein L7/L12
LKADLHFSFGDHLQTRLNIADVPIISPVAATPAAAPASSGPAAAPSEADADEPPPEKPKEKTMFKVVLKAIDAAQKAKAIKEIKAAISGMNLVEAKKFVESTPQTVKDNVPKEDAEKLKKALEAAGATVALE